MVSGVLSTNQRLHIKILKISFAFIVIIIRNPNMLTCTIFLAFHGHDEQPPHWAATGADAETEGSLWRPGSGYHRWRHRGHVSRWRHKPLDQTLLGEHGQSLFTSGCAKKIVCEDQLAVHFHNLFELHWFIFCWFVTMVHIEGSLHVAYLSWNISICITGGLPLTSMALKWSLTHHLHTYHLTV